MIFMKQIIQRLVTKFTIFSVAWLFLFANPASVPVVQAAELDAMRDQLSRIATSTAADHTITYQPSNLVAFSDPVTIVFSNGFATSTMTATTDVDISAASSSGSGYNQCDPGTVTYVSLAASSSAGAGIWGVAFSDRTITLTSPVSGAKGINASDCVRVRVGSNAASSAAGSPTGALVNPSTAGSYNISITHGAGGDTGNFDVAIVDQDSPAVTGSVDPNMSFTVGAGTTYCTDTSAVTPGGTIAFGTMGLTAINVASTSAICTRLTTNASYGAVVQVKSANGMLTSTRTAGDTVPISAQTTPAASTTPTAGGTEFYGLCIGTAGAASGAASQNGVLSGFDPYNAATTCTPGSIAGAFGELTTSYENVWRTTETASAAFVNLFAGVSLSNLSPAHNDYTDTLRFIAFGTY